MKIGKKIIGGFEDFIINEIIPIGYEDITTVDNWISIGDYLFKDYKFIRKQLQLMDFSLLTANEKVIVCQYKASSEDNCKAILGVAYNYWMSEFESKSIECRKRRFSLIKTVLIGNVNVPNRYEILGFINSTQLEANYINHGIEGLANGDPMDGMLDFVQATGTFITTGISARNLTMLHTLTKEQMVAQMVNIINFGTEK